VTCVYLIYGVHEEDGKPPAEDGVVPCSVYTCTYNNIIVYFHAGKDSEKHRGDRPPAAVDKPIRELMNFRYSREVQLLFRRTYDSSVV